MIATLAIQVSDDPTANMHETAVNVGELHIKRVCQRYSPSYGLNNSHQNQEQMKISTRVSNGLTGILADYAAKNLTEVNRELFSVITHGVTSEGKPARYLVVNSNRKVVYSLENCVNGFDCSHNGASWAALKKAEGQLINEFPNK